MALVIILTKSDLIWPLMTKSINGDFSHIKKYESYCMILLQSVYYCLSGMKSDILSDISFG